MDDQLTCLDQAHGIRKTLIEMFNLNVALIAKGVLRFDFDETFIEEIRNDMSEVNLKIKTFINEHADELEHKPGHYVHGDLMCAFCNIEIKEPEDSKGEDYG